MSFWFNGGFVGEGSLEFMAAGWQVALGILIVVLAIVCEMWQFALGPRHGPPGKFPSPTEFWTCGQFRSGVGLPAFGELALFAQCRPCWQ